MMPELTPTPCVQRRRPLHLTGLALLIAQVLILGSTRLRADDAVAARIDMLEPAVVEPQRDPAAQSNDAPATAAYSSEQAPVESRTTVVLGKVRINGEGGLAFFRHQANGRFPNGPVRVDEARLFVETPVWKDVYFFTELNLYQREDPKHGVTVGELYLDFENLSRRWKRDGQLSLRVGRLDIPFGEEYLTRDAIDSPLISHSLMDFWGVDEGVELYGALGKVQYVFAVQNGGHSSLNDYNSDKSVALRLGYDPAKRIHLSLSAMRTGDLDVKGDQLSELWFGNGFVRSLGSTNTTTFGANVFQGDAQFHWQDGHLGLAGGSLSYADNDPSAENGRDVHFYSVEAVHRFTTKFYAATRFSEIIARKGFPIVGDADFNQYFLNVLTENLWRFSVGAGYRFGPHLLIKAEYSFNHGRELGGEKRTQENLLAAEIAFKF